MKTNNQKMMQGTLKKSRIKNTINFTPLAFIPKPLEELDKVGRQYYDYVCELLLSNKTLTSADIGALTMAAKIYSVFSLAAENVKIHGYFQKTPRGYTSKNAHFQTMMDSNKALKEFESLYGLNLSSRLKLDLGKGCKKEKYFSSENDDDFS